MSKIVCEICGTEYDDSRMNACPVCGWSEGAAIGENEMFDDMGYEDGSKKNRDIFDYDAVNSGAPQEEYPDEMSAYAEDEPEEEEPRSNTALVVILTILIVLLLVASGFLAVRYLLPNLGGKKPEETAPTEIIQETEETTETTVPTVPCTGIAITSGKVELTKEGQWFLIHTVLTPEDTTDELVFTSEDESIATVDAEGKITAVGEGETKILVTCGSQSYELPVLSLFVEDLEETTEATEETQAEETNPSDETAQTEASTGSASTEATAETTAAARSDVTLKLKRTDITIGRRGVYVTLALDCDLKPEDVQWSSDNPGIASVDKEGNVTANAHGTTIVRVTYGEQEVEVWVRCIF